MVSKAKAPKKPPEPELSPLGKFLQDEFERLGKNQAWLAAEMGVSTAAANKWMKKGQISKENVPRLAKLLGRSTDDIYDAMSGTFGLKSTVRAVAKGDPLGDNEIAIKVSEIRFRGGPGHDLQYEIEEDSEPVTYQLSWLRREGINPKNLLRFRHHGDSNEPFLFHNDWIAVDTSDKQIRNGRMYAFWQHGEGRRCKKLFQKSDGSLIIRSYNPEYPEEVVKPDQLDSILIIGRVRDKGGRGGL